MVRRTAARPAATHERALRAEVAACAELVAAHHAAAAVERLARRLAGADPGTDWREFRHPARELLRAALAGQRVP